MTAPARVVRLVERGEAALVPLDPDTGRRLIDSRAVDARPVPGDPVLWEVRALDRVGVARFGDIELRIAPKLPIRRLFFLLSFRLDPAGWRDGAAVEVDAAAELLPAMAQLFERQAERALRQGLLQGYRRTEDSLPVLRGRLREHDQLRLRPGVPVPLEVGYDEFTADIAENRLLLAAATALLALPGLPPGSAVRRRLRRLKRILEVEVAPLVRGADLPAWRPSRLNARYQPALRLAELVLRGGSVEQQDGSVRIDGFLLNLATVYEAFVCTALGRALTRYGGYCRDQDPWHLDADRRIRMRPDLVWYADTGRPVGVADAKYKAEKPAGFPDADLYQMLAYCTALGVRSGHLVYARGTEPAIRHVIAGADVELVQHVLDLDQDPKPLLRDVDRIASGIAASRR
ncbi:restriction endonuclease [Mangrovactinospora gilvigrisea]|uniref:Restriction endonuclease n=1 Tax=Mangrovactinospora gilvigrisea TaxID=1428644 RepID=A0A1J7BWP3_9ACTN|nr:restriction endonuclease [Mangrovactinospora gilvigrisea]OIV37881.1 restriction endonuclease [Mangrovactinospora gilvigrisea]